MGVLLGAVAAAPQLLPTLELSARGLRQGGLSYGEVSSFSLQPLLLPWTLLPSYGLVDLGQALWHVGLYRVCGLCWHRRPAAWLLSASWRARGAAWASGLLLAALGLVLGRGSLEPLLLSALLDCSWL